jgi:hypothetical protein
MNITREVEVKRLAEPELSLGRKDPALKKFCILRIYSIRISSEIRDIEVPANPTYKIGLFVSSLCL